MVRKLKTMKNLKIISLVILISSMFIVSCEDDRLDNMVDDKVYVLKSGLNQIEIEKQGSYTYSLYVIKSGTGRQEADIQLSINETVLDSYNQQNETEYVLLPSQYYKLTTDNKHISKEEYKIPFDIILDTEAISDLQNNSEIEYALPLELKLLNSTIEIGGDKNTSILVPIINEPI